MSAYDRLLAEGAALRELLKADEIKHGGRAVLGVDKNGRRHWRTHTHPLATQRAAVMRALTHPHSHDTDRLARRAGLDGYDTRVALDSLLDDGAVEASPDGHWSPTAGTEEAERRSIRKEYRAQNRRFGPPTGANPISASYRAGYAGGTVVAYPVDGAGWAIWRRDFNQYEGNPWQLLDWADTEEETRRQVLHLRDSYGPPLESDGPWVNNAEPFPPITLNYEDAWASMFGELDADSLVRELELTDGGTGADLDEWLGHNEQTVAGQSGRTEEMLEALGEHHQRMLAELRDAVERAQNEDP